MTTNRKMVVKMDYDDVENDDEVGHYSDGDDKDDHFYDYGQRW